jgi:integrase/recombinase XerD
VTLTPLPPPTLPAVPSRARLHPTEAYLLTLAEGKSQRTQLQALQRAARIMGRLERKDDVDWRVDWWTMSSDQATILHARFSQLVKVWIAAGATTRTPRTGSFDDGGVSASSADSMRKAIRGTLKHARRQRIIDADTLELLRDSFPTTSAQRVAPGRALSLDELRAVMQGRDMSTLAIRDRAMFALGTMCGLRASEVASMKVTQSAGRSATIWGKGGKERIVPLPLIVRTARLEWLAERHGIHVEALWLACDNRGNVTGRPLSAQGVGQSMDRVARNHGLPRFSPHDMRRTTATMMLDQGEPANVVQELLGHANVGTTLRYDRGGAKRVEAASDRLSDLVAGP